MPKMFTVTLNLYSPFGSICNGTGTLSNCRKYKRVTRWQFYGNPVIKSDLLKSALTEKEYDYRKILIHLC